MAFRDKQCVIYMFPLKALSNQKYQELTQEFSNVGLMTGVVTISPNASCLVMTTKILHGMLYRGSGMLKEVAWVIFDEIHYMKDRERGVVWEESIIFVPSVIKMVYLSATMSNATEFVEWICNLHKQPCHIVYTYFRPTSLQHYVFPVGGSGLYLIVDENEQFKDDHFVKLQDTFAKQKKQGDGNKSRNANSSGRIVKNGTSFGGSDIYKIVKFAMGLNMPAKTALFTSVRKWDGDSHQIIRSGEYTQYEKVRLYPFMTFINSLFVLVYYLISTFLYYVHALPEIGERVLKLEKEAAMLDASGEGELAEYHKLILDIAQLEKKMMSEIIRPERVLYFLLPGRLLQKFCNEQKNRSWVLKKLGHIDADGVVQLKRQAACLINTGDELLIAEQMFNGTFNDLDHHQVAVLASYFIPRQKSNEQIHLRTELGKC
ncbi:hypothetical protein GIB67_022062 [Kingdonia uniflora]|uniref:Helicase ATP-binding domain-containing protein n=1 Tax=Kingdonia uniflora TaxID=39325 RepID=A0A7J7MU80_9MAGN|nr:hypothetical protein GIB67_022062 [Kingdonia uniflora]